MSRRPSATRTGLTLAAALFALASVVSCGSASGQGSLEGLVVAVEGDLSTVESFDVLSGGTTHTFIPAQDGVFAFPLPHLREHILSGVPVIILWEERDDVRYAVSIDDADPSGHP